MSRRYLISEAYVKPGMWRLDYHGTETPFYLPPQEPVYIPTNVYFDFDAEFPVAFMLSEEFHNEGLRLRSLLTERGKEIRISFNRRPGDTEWLRMHAGSCIGFITPATFF